MQLARFCGFKELRFDDMVIGNTAPYALKQVTTFFGNTAGPATIFVNGIHPRSSSRDRSLPVRGAIFGVKRAGQGHGLDNRAVITARNISHERTHTPGMLDQRA